MKVNKKPVLFGVSSLRTPEILPVEVIQHINARLGDEYTAYFFYLAASNWCSGAGYNKAATFFYNEAQAELTHAKGLMDYLTKWNVVPTIGEHEMNPEFEGLVDIVNKAYDMEYSLLDKYMSAQKRMFELHQPTFNMLQAYVDYQNDEVAEYSDYLNGLSLIDTTSKFEIMYFEREYFGQ